MTSDDLKLAVRQKVWRELRNYARPDSRFHWDFGQFIPDFEGSQVCADTIRAMDWYRQAEILFITPDNCLERLRQYAMEDGKHLLVTTYGIARGFFYLPPGRVPTADLRLAATLDGMEYFAQPIRLSNIAAMGPVGLLVTGASLITLRGVRWGKGHGFFDLEWAMLREIGAVVEGTPIVAVGHDCQVQDLEIDISPYDTIVDRIVTPTRVIDVPADYPKPTGIYWDLLKPEMIASIPPLQELQSR